MLANSDLRKENGFNNTCHVPAAKVKSVTLFSRGKKSKQIGAGWEDNITN